MKPGDQIDIETICLEMIFAFSILVKGREPELMSGLCSRSKYGDFDYS